MEMRNKVHRLFGSRAGRVTTDEMRLVVEELSYMLRHDIPSLRSTRSLPCKLDHGDIDLVYRLEVSLNIKEVLSRILGERIFATHKNGDVYSVLYHCETLGKDIHVDFIHANDLNFRTKLQYYSYNDFSGIFGMLSKKLHFKYGSEGFFKRYHDTRGNWHDLWISYDLMDGLKILGYDPAKWETLQTYDDIATFMLSSPMFDCKYFEHKSLNQSDKKSMKRPVVEYVVAKLRESGQTATVTDEDFYFYRDFLWSHAAVAVKKSRIEDALIPKSKKYDGNWLKSNFPMVKQGPEFGKVLKLLSTTFGEQLEITSEQLVSAVVYDYLSKQKG